MLNSPNIPCDTSKRSGTAKKTVLEYNAYSFTKTDDGLSDYFRFSVLVRSLKNYFFSAYVADFIV